MLNRIISQGMWGHRWLHFTRNDIGTQMRSFVYPTGPGNWYAAYGVKNLWGCTSVIIASRGGIFLSNIWEYPTFQTRDHRPQSEDFFGTHGFDILRYGNPADPSGESRGFRNLQGPEGFLNSRMKPIVFIITPFTREGERQRLGIETELRYEAKVRSLAAALRRSIRSPEPPHIIGYTRHVIPNMPGAQGDDTQWGKAIVEVDQDNVATEQIRGHDVVAADGSWRLWVEDRVVYEQQYTYVEP
ncbi:MAG: hypothetical protein M1822_009117 [Bathelium mastoideum]|nr:MAG: hypothetical protein M1822_009117 [Bathelium mastoideum]